MSTRWTLATQPSQAWISLWRILLRPLPDEDSNGQTDPDETDDEDAAQEAA